MENFLLKFMFKSYIIWILILAVFIFNDWHEFNQLSQWIKSI